MWNEVAYSFMPVNRELGFRLREKAHFWADPDLVNTINNNPQIGERTIPKINELEDLIKEFLKKYYPEKKPIRKVKK